MSPYRGRFAPSPTGALHLGTARTALLAWLRARRSGGDFILRIEDLDEPRVKPGAQAAILADLAWLGLDWDEGPDKGGAFGPYLQSEREGGYEEAFQRLQAAGHLYPCTCSRRDLEQLASAPHGEAEQLYPGYCRQGPRQPERPPAWRFRMDAAESFMDLLAGPQDGLQEDFVVRRADGIFSYQLACVVDDAAMGVTEVLRGDDLLGSVSRQQALHRALGFGPPAWAHAPLLLGADGQRLSKRHGSVAVSAYREAGWDPRSLLGVLAETLDLAAPGERVGARQLIDRLDFSRLPRTADRFQGPWPLPLPEDEVD